MKKTYLIALLLLGLFLAVILGLALQGVVRQSIIVPILYLAWLADLVFRSIPGWLWWIWFLVIAVVIVSRTLRVRTKGGAAVRRDSPPPLGPVRAWAERVYVADRGDYFRWRLARDLAELSLQHTTSHDRRALTRYDRVGAIATLDAPPEITAYLQAGLAAPPWQPTTRFSKLKQLWQRSKELSPLELDPQKAVQFLEGQLERHYDD